MARLSLLDADTKQNMKREIESELTENTLTEETLGRMEQLHNFVLEVQKLYCFQNLFALYQPLA